MGRMNKEAMENGMRRASTVNALLQGNPDLETSQRISRPSEPQEPKKPIIVQVNLSLKKDFAIACKLSGSDVSKVLTRYMERYVAGMKDDIEVVKRRKEENEQ